MKRKTVVAFALMFGLASATQAQGHFSPSGLTFRHPKPNPETLWVDSVMNGMTLDERIAQLMIVRVPLNMDDKQTAEFAARMNGYGVGGVCFFVGTAERQVPQTRTMQAGARLPLMVCIDGEWGLGMRLKDMYSFPKNDRFGRLDPEQDSIVFRMGQEIGRQCREMGIHVNFAPVVDINSNPRNPVIGTRSFGIDRERVAQLGIMYALGQQSQGVLATAKHFPGHGDTETDSHLELPVINHSLEYIDTVDTYPFRRLIEAGVGGVMVAHLQVNALDAERPSSLSPIVVDSLLRRAMGFDGIIVTDGLDMKGVTNTYGNGQGELAALMAGNDLLLLPPDVPQGIATIKEAAERDQAVRQAVDLHCRRVLQAKYRLVMPHVGEEIGVPDNTRREACQDIVADLNLATDQRIDDIVRKAIADHAMPGCQVAVMHKGRLVASRTYGHTTYEPLPLSDADSALRPVDRQTLYDLASLTKVCATTLAVMHLVDAGKITIDDRLSDHLPYLKGTNKEKITIKEVMSHCARLKAFDSYWQQTSDRDSLLRLVAESPLNSKGGYLYSDLGFILLSDLVARVGGMPLDEYADRYFYRPMGLTHTYFNPLSHGARLSNIAPTELDTASARTEQGYIWGQVHDPNAAAMGGISGHAGLFSTAEDVARIMQMLLNGGTLDGHRYLNEQTVNTFTSRHYAANNNRRALGFDKQLFTPSNNAQVCPEASQASFGHTGFTGTMVWVDPENELVFVFLSNRVHPTSTPNRLAQLNVRTKIQSLLYDDISKAKK